MNEVGKDAVNHEPTGDAYRKYHEYCLANSLQAMSNIEFSKQVKNRFGFDIVCKKINGKTYRVFEEV